MTRVPILLVGAGGHARACIDVIEQEGCFQIAALLGQPEEVGGTVLGYPIVGSNDDLLDVAARIGSAIVTVGQIKSPQRRIDLFEALERAGCRLPVIVSPSAVVSRHARVGDGTIVLHGAIVNAGATIGRNCILNSQSLVEHDAIVDSHCHVATSAVLNGGVRIGTGTFIGSAATVRQGVTIGARCVVGMGERVFSDCADGVQIPPARLK